MGGGYEVRECDADWCRLSGRAFYFGVVGLTGGGVTGERPEVIIV